MQVEFKNKLTELGLSYSIHHNGSYSISSQQDFANQINVRLISSLPVNMQVHGSKNGNDVLAMGLFRYKFHASEQEPDICVFAFQNPVTTQVEFLIVPTQELLSRQIKKNLGLVPYKWGEIVFWLMEDGFIYDTTNISVEAEWYFLSKGVNRRLADGTDLDYSEYLNSWRRLIV